MLDLPTLIQHGANLWLFAPSAIALGALHGLEPGHSKTMMAAFIVAVRGTVAQAVMLALAATASHTAVVWLVALGGLYFGSHWQGEASEPYFQIASAAAMIAVSLWMLWHTYRHQAACFHDHGEAQPRYRRKHGHDHDHTHDEHDHHTHSEHGNIAAFADIGAGAQDAHERAHAVDIQRRFANREVTTGQIIVFGLTGGLIPCPASITVLLICLQLKQIAMGATLVLCFSVGLALTMVAAGTIAALSVKHVSKRWSGFGELSSRAPYFSGGLILLVGMYIGYTGIRGLT